MRLPVLVSPLGLVALAFAASSACDSRPGLSLARKSGAEAAAVSSNTGQQEPLLRLRRLSVTDPQMNGAEAFRMLVPTDWRTEGGIVWRPDLATLAYAQMRVSNPNGVERLELFPTVPFTWRDGGIIGFTVGSLYLGMYVQPPMDAATFVAQIVLPQVRGDVHPTIVGREELPSVAREVASSIQEPGASKRVVAQRTRVEYQEEGRWIEEDIYCVLVYTQTVITPGVTFWGPDRLYGFRAEKGQLDRQAPLLQAMGSSVWVNPAWFSRYVQVRDMWVQNQMAAIRRTGELSRYLAQTSDQIRAEHQQAWEQRQAAQDRMSAEFSEYIRGVETYRDPYLGRDVQLPSNFEHVWVSRDGEYVLSHEALYNPNVGSSQTWEQIEPIKR